MNTRYLKLSLIALALLAIGCGRVSNNGQIRVSATSWNPGSSAVTTTSSEDANYNCPSSNNIVPDYDQDHDGSGYFKVCTSKTLISDILIHGKSKESTICVFPAQYVDATHVYLKPDPQNGSVWSLCGDAVSGGVALSFENTTYNSVFVVEASNRGQMAQCLAQSNSYQCPSYSFGKFRSGQ